MASHASSDRSGRSPGRRPVLNPASLYWSRNRKESAARTAEREALVSVVLFDDRTDVLYDRVEMQKVEPMNDSQYYVRGCTALLDAVGGAIHHIGNVHKYARNEDVPEKTLFIITTDGMENSSRVYGYDRVKRMIEHQKEKYHWEFLFLGANIDAVSVAGRFGIDSKRAVRYMHDEEGTRLNYETMSKAVFHCRMAPSAEEMSDFLDDEDLLAPVREDYERRHKR